jgi:hypothetical protein
MRLDRLTGFAILGVYHLGAPPGAGAQEAAIHPVGLFLEAPASTSIHIGSPSPGAWLPWQTVRRDCGACGTKCSRPSEGGVYAVGQRSEGTFEDRSRAAA